MKRLDFCCSKPRSFEKVFWGHTHLQVCHFRCRPRFQLHTAVVHWNNRTRHLLHQNLLPKLYLSFALDEHHRGLLVTELDLNSPATFHFTSPLPPSTSPLLCFPWIHWFVFFVTLLLGTAICSLWLHLGGSSQTITMKFCFPSTPTNLRTHFHAAPGIVSAVSFWPSALKNM